MNINTIKREIENNIGKTVQITVYGLRNKKETYNGKINTAYPNIFSIKMSLGDKTFSYADVAIGDVKIKYLN